MSANDGEAALFQSQNLTTQISSSSADRKTTFLRVSSPDNQKRARLNDNLDFFLQSFVLE